MCVCVCVIHKFCVEHFVFFCYNCVFFVLQREYVWVLCVARNKSFVSVCVYCIFGFVVVVV